MTADYRPFTLNLEVIIFLFIQLPFKEIRQTFSYSQSEPNAQLPCDAFIDISSITPPHISLMAHQVYHQKCSRTTSSRLLPICTQRTSLSNKYNVKLSAQNGMVLYMCKGIGDLGYALPCFHLISVMVPCFDLYRQNIKINTQAERISHRPPSCP